jgi:hypothetical protein
MRRVLDLDPVFTSAGVEELREACFAVGHDKPAMSQLFHPFHSISADSPTGFLIPAVGFGLLGP